MDLTVIDYDEMNKDPFFTSWKTTIFLFFKFNDVEPRTTLVAPPVGIILFFANISLASEDWEFFKSP